MYSRGLCSLVSSHSPVLSLVASLTVPSTTTTIMSEFTTNTASNTTTSSSGDSRMPHQHHHHGGSAKVGGSYKHGSISEKLSAHSNLNGQLPSAKELENISQTLFECRVVISDAVCLKEKLRRFQDAGLEQLQVVSDFDFTISKFLVNGSRGASCHRIIEDCGLLSEDYHHQAQAIQKKYYPLEVDPTLDNETRTQYMVDWVNQAHALLSRTGVTKQIIHQAVTLAFEQKRFDLRKHVVNFFDLLQQTKVPLLIFSAGIADVLEDVLKRTVDLPQYDITVISNRGVFNEETGQLVDFETPVIHVFNKMSSAFLHSPYFQRTDWRTRRHVILLGDSQGDVTMTEGMEKDEDDILRIGFLSDRLERLELYQDIYDIVILDDPGFEVPIGIVDRILKQDMDNLEIVDKFDDSLLTTGESTQVTSETTQVTSESI